MNNEATAASAVSNAGDDYIKMCALVREAVASAKVPLFRTDAEPLAWSTWHQALPTSERQHHDCHACRRFFDRYGGLAWINAVGELTPLLNIAAPGIFGPAFLAVYEVVRKAKVVDAFVSSDTLWGAGSTLDKKRDRAWHHVCAPSPGVYSGRVLNAGQRTAEITEDRATLARSIAEFGADVVNSALSLAQGEVLYRGEKVHGRLVWLAELHASLADARGTRRDNILWQAAATAPVGFCHVRSSVVGSLLEDLASGKSVDVARRSFEEKMNPLKYQRPTAPPSAGNVAQAEKIVAELGSAGALHRRYARLDDVKKLWSPAPVRTEQHGGVFGHLLAQTPAGVAGVAAGPAMTWEKFARVVLPTAESMEVIVPNHGAYHALVTAVDPAAPPILQWDREDARCPVSWYTYSQGSHAASWNLRGGAAVAVTAITLLPHMWSGHPGGHQGEGVILLLDGCRDTRVAGAGLGLFPEILKSDYHAIRATIEAHSRRGQLEGAAEATACGIAIRSGSGGESVQVRVHCHGVVTAYQIDRWN